MYQIQGVDLPSIFLAAQQARQSQQQQRLNELKLSEEQRQSEIQRMLPGWRANYFAGNPEPLQRNAPNEYVEFEKLNASNPYKMKITDAMSNVAGWLGLDPKTPEAWVQDARFRPALEQYLNKVSGGKSKPETATELRKEFNGLAPVKEAQSLINSYYKVASATPTAAGDMSLVFGYMKLLDPTSSVRESEQAQAQNAGSIPLRVQALWNSVFTGERLTPEQRANIRAEAEKLTSAGLQTYYSFADRFSGLAVAAGVNPEDVVVIKGLPRQKSSKDPEQKPATGPGPAQGIPQKSWGQPQQAPAQPAEAQPGPATQEPVRREPPPVAAPAPLTADRVLATARTAGLPPAKVLSNLVEAKKISAAEAQQLMSEIGGQQ